MTNGEKGFSLEEINFEDFMKGAVPAEEMIKVSEQRERESIKPILMEYIDHYPQEILDKIPDCKYVA